MNNVLSRYIAENINGDMNLSENDVINYNIKKFNETIEQSKKSDFYSKKLKDIKNIKYLKAIENIPFTSEDEIREEGEDFVFGYFAESDAVEITVSLLAAAIPRIWPLMRINLLNPKGFQTQRHVGHSK